MGFRTKSGFESAHFTSAPGPAATQLQKALTSDPDHIVPDRMLRPGENQKLEALRPIQEALNKLFDAGVFLDLVRIPQGEIDGQKYGTETERAVLAFKKKLDIRGPGQSQADPICGRSTLAQLDDEIRNRVEGGGAPDKPVAAGRFVDVVVDILGFGGNNSPNQGVDLGGGSLKFLLETGNYKALNRDLTVIQFTGSGDNRNPVDTIVRRVEDALRGNRRGVICIRGESAGGPNTLQLAAALQRRQQPLAYVGIADGAFGDRDAFPPPAISDPPVPIPIPIIKAPPITAGRKLNIFQSFGNGIGFSVSLGRKIWQGGMPNAEIHGVIQGWSENVDLTVTGNVRGPGLNATGAHTLAAGEGLATHQGNIQRVLESLPKS